MSLTRAQIDSYIRARRDEKAADGTVDRELEILRRAYRLSAENGGPVFGPRFPRLVKLHANARKGFLDPGTLAKILKGIADPDFRDYLEWFSWTGMRPHEISCLSWASYDRQTETLRLHAADAKIGRGRIIPIVGPLVPIMERRLSVRRLDCPLVFHCSGQPIGASKGGLKDRCYSMWRRACKAIGQPDLIPYDLRRTVARNLRAAGIAERIIMEITGHLTRSTFDRYGIVDERDLKSAFETVGQYVESFEGKSNVATFPSSHKERTN
jgi:integrase